jgi:serine/threonine protein kinase
MHGRPDSNFVRQHSHQYSNPCNTLENIDIMITRLDIIIYVFIIANNEGLEYLHKACNPPLIHRDVKTSNILLNKNFEARIANFGLSRIFNNGERTNISTAVVGTPGYLDPEYGRFSFGFSFHNLLFL